MKEIALARINSFASEPEATAPPSEEIFVLTSGQLQDLVRQAIERATAPLTARLDALEERGGGCQVGGEDLQDQAHKPGSSPDGSPGSSLGAQGSHVLQDRIFYLEDENRGLKEALSNLEELRPWMEALSKKIARLESRPGKESPKGEEHIEELYQVMRNNKLPSLSFANAAKFLGISKGRVKQLKPQIAKDGRFDILHSTSHKQKLIIALRRHGAKTG